MTDGVAYFCGGLEEREQNDLATDGDQPLT